MQLNAMQVAGQLLHHKFPHHVQYHDIFCKVDNAAPKHAKLLLLDFPDTDAFCIFFFMVQNVLNYDIMILSTFGGLQVE